MASSSAFPLGNPIKCTNPANLEVLGEVPITSDEEVKRIVARSREVQKDWAKTTFADRKRLLNKILDFVIKNQTMICELSSKDTGKTMMEAEFGEILTTCEKIRYTCKYGEKILSPETRRVPLLLMTKKARVEYHPLGVVGIIIPWNYPFHNFIGAFVSAIFAGNTCVVKPSEHAVWSSQIYATMIRNIIKECGFEPDICQFVYGYGQTGSTLIKANCDRIHFIGSPQVGRLVMHACADSPAVTPVMLELGGKDPFIVFDDCDLEGAIHTALRGVFTNCGQNCIAAERIYVQAAIYDKFVDKASEIARTFRQGDPLACEVDCGAITMPRQLDIIGDLVQDAIDRGARVMAGGKRNPSLKGQFFMPTVLADVKHDMRIVKEEAFGPVMLICRFETEEEVINLANDTPYALSSCIFTRDYKKAERVAKQVLAGMCVVNDFGIPYMIQDCPFGGVRISGFGKFNGPEGLQGNCFQKTVVTDRFPIKNAIPRWTRYPVPTGAHEIIQSAIKMIYSSNISEAVKGGWNFIGKVLSA